MEKLHLREKAAAVALAVGLGGLAVGWYAEKVEDTVERIENFEITIEDIQNAG